MSRIASGCLTALLLAFLALPVFGAEKATEMPTAPVSVELSPDTPDSGGIGGEAEETFYEWICRNYRGGVNLLWWVFR
jgi:hypothetical protein